MSELAGMPERPPGVLFALGFRPFFLGASLYAIVAIAQWMGIYLFQWPAPFAQMTPFQWHAHEMIYGYSMAVVAGFLLTAVGNWTGRRTAHGYWLLALFALWLSARLVWLTGLAPLSLAGIMDLGFMGALFAALARPCIQARQWQQLGILAKLLLLALGNLAFYLGAGGGLESGQHWGLYGGLYLVIGLVLTMARRVVPFFIERGVGYEVRLSNSKWLDLSSLVLFLVFFVSEVFLRNAALSAWTAAALFAVTTVRLIGWHTAGIWRKPLLWSLYAALLFIDAGFLLFALSVFVDLPRLPAIHTFAFGGIGIITLSMMSRVTLGHTGRDVQSPPGQILPALLLLVLGAVVRVLPPLFTPHDYAAWIGLSQLLWIAAFVLFVAAFTPMFVRPRIDGKPG